MKNVLALLICTALAACATYDQRMATDLTPNADGTWTYRSFADVATPLNSEAGENRRLEMLEIWLKNNSLCPGGYVVQDRQVLHRGGAVSDVIYRIGCA